MTGDIGEEGVSRISADPADLSSLVLKVPHHGSSRSSPLSFFETVRPRAAIISCGYENRYGFPGNRPIERLRAVGADVFRTDLDGAVTVTTDGGYLKIETMTGRRLFEKIAEAGSR
jgi:competence protein ComEC